jgi:hypothetical protein
VRKLPASAEGAPLPPTASAFGMDADCNHIAPELSSVDFIALEVEGAGRPVTAAYSRSYMRRLAQVGHGLCAAAAEFRRPVPLSSEGKLTYFHETPYGTCVIAGVQNLRVGLTASARLTASSAGAHCVAVARTRGLIWLRNGRRHCRHAFQHLSPSTDELTSRAVDAAGVGRGAFGSLTLAMSSWSINQPQWNR